MGRAYPFLLFFSTAMALLGSFQFGYHIAVLNTSLKQVADSLGFPKGHDASIVSTVLLGALFGALGAGNFADKIGPKKATVLNSLPLVLGSAIAATARNEVTFVVGRLLSGVGVGAASLLVPRVLTEIAPTRIRGLISTLNQVFINVGIVSAFCAGWPLESDASYHISIGGHCIAWWRCMVALGVIPGVVQAVGMMGCPETPVWLLWAGFHLQATASHRALHGDECEEEENQLVADENNYPENETLENNGSHAAEGIPALWDHKYGRIMLLAAGLPLLQQFSGINTVILYGSDVLRTAGITSPIFANLVLGLVNLVATVVAAGLMDKAGRKMLLTWSFAGMAVCLGSMSIIMFLHVSSDIAAQASFWAILAYIMCFAFGCGPVPWVYLPEILPDAIKGPAQAAGTALSWLGNLFVGGTFPAMMDTIGLKGSYAFYGLACAGAAAFCGAFMVETKQRRLLAVHAELMRSS